LAIVKNKIFGRGLSFPLRTAPDGGFAKDIDSSRIVQSGINIILLHRLQQDPDTGNYVGERVWRPEFGSMIGVLKHEPNHPPTYRKVRKAIIDPIQKWEPRIKDLLVNLIPSENDPYVIYVFVSFKLISTNEVGNLVYPLYLE